MLLLQVAGCAAYRPSARLEPASAPQGKSRQIYGDDRYQFFWGIPTPDGTWADVLAHDLSSGHWKRISEVSLANGKLGHQPKANAEIYMDFAAIYGGREYAPLPLRTSMDGSSGFGILPDKILFDAHGEVYQLFFSSTWSDDAVTTRLEIRRKDLDDAFKK